MDFSLSPDQLRIQELCVKLAADFETRAARHDREASSPRENYATLRDAGLYGIVVPTEYGGSGGGLLDYAIAAEALGAGCASTALSFNMHCAVAYALTNGDALPEARRRFVADLIVRRRKLLCATFSEPGTTGLVYSTRALSTQARRVPGGRQLNGAKAFVSMAEACDYITAFVHPEESNNPLEGMPVMVPPDAPGVRIEDVWDSLGMRATCSNKVVLNDVFVPDEFVFDELRIQDVPAWLAANEGPIDLPYTAVYLGVGFAALRAIVANVRERRPKGYTQPLAYHPDVRRRVARMSSELEAARWLVRYAAWCLDRGDDPDAGAAAMFRAKYAVGEAVAAAGRGALEVGGAHSLFRGSTIERLFRDTATASIMQPHSDVCLAELSVKVLGLERRRIPPPLERESEE